MSVYSCKRALIFFIQDLYRFALKKGAEPPFSLTSYPREMLVVGDDSIISHCLDGSVLIIESCDEEIDKFLDVLELKQVSYAKVNCPTLDCQMNFILLPYI